jgi:hypothetical protein
VEAGVGHAQKTPLKGQRFESLEAAQAYLDRARDEGNRLGRIADVFFMPGGAGLVECRHRIDSCKKVLELGIVASNKKAN